MRFRAALSAGMIDAGFASLATFGTGLVATRYLDAETLGIFAVYYVAFITATVIPRSGLFVPIEVGVLQLEDRGRLTPVGRAVRLAAGPALLAGGVLAVVAAVITWAEAAVTLPLMATMVATAVVSPLQDHVRRMLHFAGMSWHAGVVSLVQFLGVAIAAAVLLASGVDKVWVPFGSLFAANAASMTAGLVMVRLGRTGPPSGVESIRVLFESGRYLLLAGLLPPIGGMVVSGLVLRLAGAEALGHAEAARVVTSPILTISTGLAATFRPRSMTAGHTRDQTQAKRLERLFITVLLTLGGGYVAIVSFDWPGNPMAALVPSAYVVGGLVLARGVANLAMDLSAPSMNELVGGRQEAGLVRVEGLGALARTVVAGSASVTKSFALPMGDLCVGIIRRVRYGRMARRYYAADVETGG